MVIDITTDDTRNESEVRERIRKRFEEIDDHQRKKEQAGSVWVMVLYIGFLITFIGVLAMLFFLGIIPLRLETIVSAAIILFGAFFIAVAFFLKGSPSLVMDDL